MSNGNIIWSTLCTLCTQRYSDLDQSLIWANFTMFDQVWLGQLAGPESGCNYDWAFHLLWCLWTFTRPFHAPDSGLFPLFIFIISYQATYFYCWGWISFHLTSQVDPCCMGWHSWWISCFWFHSCIHIRVLGKGRSDYGKIWLFTGIINILIK